MEIDKNSLNKLKSKLKKLPARELQVGWFNGVNTAPITNTRYENTAYIAYILHNGSENGGQPPRPFFNHLMTIRKYETERIMAKVAKKMTMGIADFSEEEAAIARLVSDIIDDFSDPPNTPATIKGKGFNNPLIETGNLMETVKGRVV